MLYTIKALILTIRGARFGAFCTPAFIAASLAAMCAGVMGFCLINCTRQS